MSIDPKLNEKILQGLPLLDALWKFIEDGGTTDEFFLLRERFRAAKRNASHEARQQFQNRITQPPYERSVLRLGPTSSWPGHYKEYEVQLAWEFYQAGGEDSQEQSRDLIYKALGSYDRGAAIHPIFEGFRSHLGEGYQKE